VFRTFGLVVLLTAVFTALRAGASSCPNLAALKIPDVRMISAENVPAGRFTPSNSHASPMILPTFCRVIATIHSAVDAEVAVEVWLPDEAEWNGKFEGVGNGGYGGSISYQAMGDALERHYATASTDTGHEGDDLRFANGHPERIIDWGYRAIHLMTEMARLIVRNYEGRFPKHSYFNGCSTGGGQALSEAQRFPSDYDGLLIGAPGNNRTHLNVGFLSAFAADHQSASSVFPTNKLPALHKAAVAACDRADGIEDGIISDPMSCHFDPHALLCTQGDNNACLTSAQADTVQKIYAGPLNPRTHESIFPGYEPGSEASEEDPNGGWKAYITDPQEPMRLDFWRYWVFNDPMWDWHSFDYDRDVAYADQKMAAVNAISPELGPFEKAGGKIIMYHGWADPVAPPRASINYFDRVIQAMGPAEAQRFMRLFMIPGMGHCGHGSAPLPWPDNTQTMDISRSPKVSGRTADDDFLDALDRWVDRGVAPETIQGSQVVDSVLLRTRPICAYPMVAKWDRMGSSNKSASFVCATK